MKRIGLITIAALFLVACGTTENAPELASPPKEQQPPAEQTQDPAPTPEPNPAPAPAPTPNPAPTPAPAGDNITQIEIETAVSAANQPFTFGQIFNRGDLPSGTQLIGVLDSGKQIPLQLDVKTRHADSSVRHGIISGILTDATVGTRYQLALKKSAPGATSKAVMTVPEILNTGLSAVISITQAGITYNASATDALNKNLIETWLSGDQVTEFIAKAPLKNSAGASHPLLQARFYIRAYKSGDIRVSFVVENNWTYAEKPGNQTYDLNVTLNNQTVLQQTNLTHYHHARWRRVFWTTVDPDLHIKHDITYLDSTRAIPHYDQTLRINEGTLITLDQAWTNEASGLMKIGTISAYMPATGAAPRIGPLPQFTALYLNSMDRRAKFITLKNAEQAGTWRIHYRDQNTDLPISIDDYPYVTELGSRNDTYNPTLKRYEALPDCPNKKGEACYTPYTPDRSHQPSIAYVPYMVTGDYYFMEELAFWANWNLVRENGHYRGFSSGLFYRSQVRAQGWTLRTLGHAASLMPDAHSMKSYFVEKLANNRKFYYDNYVSNSSTFTYKNELGWISPVFYGTYISPWMDDFFTWATGHMVELGFEDWLPIHEWKAKFPIGRMTDPGYCWVLGAPYQIEVRAESTDTWFPSLAAMYQNYTKAFPNSAGGTSDISNTACASNEMADAIAKALGYGIVAGEIPGYSASATGFPSNAQPALAIAVDMGVANAANAWNTFDNRAVKPTYPYYDEAPQFALVPR